MTLCSPPYLIRDDFFNPPAAESDPTSDFLAREKAILGDEFTSGGDSTSFDKDFEQSASAFPDLDGAEGDEAGLEGFVSGGSGAVPPAVAAIPKGPYEGGMGAQVSVTGTNEFAAFESEYPEVEVTPAPQVSSLVSCWSVAGRHRGAGGAFERVGWDAAGWGTVEEQSKLTVALFGRVSLISSPSAQRLWRCRT